jgi:N-acetylmuramoyl-L-alanine amidase
MKRATILLFICVLTLGTVPAGSSRFQIRYRVVSNTRYLFMRDIATYYGMSYAHGGKKVTLSSRYSRLLFTIGRRESVLNGIKAHLSFAPTVANGEALMSSSDFQLLLDPVLRPSALPKKQVRRVMIDPGHGGKDRGTKGRRFEEKDVCMQIAQRTAAALRKRGYTVALTRDGDRTLSLNERAALCERWGADVFVSIHANYVGTASVRGIETFLVTPHGATSTYGSSPASSSSKNNRYDKENARLAYEVQKAMVRATGAPDRGIKHARFLVLRDSGCPSILVETGFMSNSTEESLLGSAAYQEKLAAGITEGVARYEKSLLKAP